MKPGRNVGECSATVYAGAGGFRCSWHCVRWVSLQPQRQTSSRPGRLGGGSQDAVYFAYFAPYSFEAHQALVARTQCDPRVNLELLGETLDGHDIDLLKIGVPRRLLLGRSRETQQRQRTLRVLDGTADRLPPSCDREAYSRRPGQGPRTLSFQSPGRVA